MKKVLLSLIPPPMTIAVSAVLYLLIIIAAYSRSTLWLLVLVAVYIVLRLIASRSIN
jgi:hypothetical protein